MQQLKVYKIHVYSPHSFHNYDTEENTMPASRRLHEYYVTSSARQVIAHTLVLWSKCSM